MNRTYFILAVIIALGFIATFSFMMFSLPLSDEDTFCTSEDKVYQAIETHHKEWIEYYRPILAASGFTSPELVFNLENRQGYSVDASVWRSTRDAPRFFVVTEWGWQERFGVKGYFFSPPGVPIIERLRFQRLSGNVYCYWFE